MVIKKTPKAGPRHARNCSIGSSSRTGATPIPDSCPAASSSASRSRVRWPCSRRRLLCDEITSALDPELVGEVLDVVRELAEDGMTMMIVTHEMGFAREVCNRVVFMHQGRVHEAGPPEEVFANPQTAELKQFLGVN